MPFLSPSRLLSLVLLLQQARTSAKPATGSGYRAGCCMICPVQWVEGLTLLELPPDLETQAVHRFHAFYLDHHGLAPAVRAPVASPSASGSPVASGSPSASSLLSAAPGRRLLGQMAGRRRPLSSYSLLEARARARAGAADATGRPSVDGMPKCCKVCAETFVGTGDMDGDPTLLLQTAAAAAKGTLSRAEAAARALALRRARARARMACQNEDRMDDGYPLGTLLEQAGGKVSGRTSRARAAEARTGAGARAKAHAGGCPPMTCCSMCSKQGAVPRDFRDVNFLQEYAGALRERRTARRQLLAAAGEGEEEAHGGGRGHRGQGRGEEEGERSGGEDGASDGTATEEQAGGVGGGAAGRRARSSAGAGGAIAPDAELRRGDFRFRVEDDDSSARHPPTSPSRVAPRFMERVGAGAGAGAEASQGQGEGQGQGAGAGYNNMFFEGKKCCRICKWRLTGELGTLPYFDNDGDKVFGHPKNPNNKRSYKLR